MRSLLDRWRHRLKQIRPLRRAYRALYSAYWSGRTRVLETARTLRFPFTVRHLHGPPDVSAGATDLIVVCLVRDGASYVEEFIDHYRTLGARHLVFLDNGSTDDTIPLIRAHDRTTVLASDADFGTYNPIMRRYLISRYGADNWVLCVDIDEFFDYPYSDRVGLDEFLSYLNEHEYNAVALQMLDMLPGTPLSALDDAQSIRAAHPYYDVSNVTTYDYASNPWLHGNDIDNPDLQTHRGGVRQALFDLRPERPLLTKHMLLRLTRGLRARDVRTHHIDNAFIADVSCVLYHYKFHTGFREYARRVVREGTHSNDSEEYRAYLNALQNGGVTLKTDNMRRLEAPDELVDQGFLSVSEQYAEHVRRAADGRRSL
jgi:hypothetical protein